MCVCVLEARLARDHVDVGLSLCLHRPPCFSSLVRVDLVHYYAVLVASCCVNVTMVLSLCHLCLLPAAHSDTSGTLPALFLTRSSGDLRRQLAVSLSHDPGR